MLDTVLQIESLFQWMQSISGIIEVILSFLQIILMMVFQNLKLEKKIQTSYIKFKIPSILTTTVISAFSSSTNMRGIESFNMCVVYFKF